MCCCPASGGQMLPQDSALPCGTQMQEAGPAGGKSRHRCGAPTCRSACTFFRLEVPRNEMTTWQA